MDDFDPDFCFYDEDGYRRDADAESLRLQATHAMLWSKELPTGERLNWVPETGTTAMTCSTSDGRTFRVSSDTIATSHSGYREMHELYSRLAVDDRDALERTYYTIGGFIVFPRHPNSINQCRGTDRRIADRFDLTLECIRRHYTGEQDNPLGDVLYADADFFALFGHGLGGFVNYVDFFLLQDLCGDGTIRWFDGSETDQWDFDTPPLPATPTAYDNYLGNVRAFVAARTDRIREQAAR